MTDFITITCPHCSEDFQTAVDTSEGSSQFVVDCEVCCRPMTIKLRVRDGEVMDQEISGE